MSIKKFDQNQSYEWVGSFWFPDEEVEPKEEFSGKVTYTPEKGVRLELLSEFKNDCIKQEILSKKIMHGVVRGEEVISLTLINVFLSTGFMIGNPTCKTLIGSAQGLMANELVEDTNFDKVMLQYDEHFENIFLNPANREGDTIKFSKGDSVHTNCGYEISMDINSFGPILFSADQLDTVFYSNDEETLQKIKDAVAPIIKDNSCSLFKRKETTLAILFQKEDAAFHDIFRKEEIWRSYWELIVDHQISVKNIWLYTKYLSDDGAIKYNKRPFLCSLLLPRKQRRKPSILGHLSLDFYSFGAQAWNLSVVEKAMNSWLEINANPDWIPVIDGIQRVLRANNDLVDSTKYVSLISEIETFLDLLEERPSNVDTLIQLYASKKWNSDFKKLNFDLPQNETYGKWASEVRNVITHPIGAKDKGGGKYRTIASDSFQLQKLYAYIGGLLIKGVLLHIGDLDEDKLEEFIMKFIKSRGSFYPVNFE